MAVSGMGAPGTAGPGTAGLGTAGLGTAGSSARVTLRFEAPATDVQVNVHGVDGLEVKGVSTPISGSSFTPGSETSFDVAFTPGAGRSHLVVSVTGLFEAHGSRPPIAGGACPLAPPARCQAPGTPGPSSRSRTPPEERVRCHAPG